jgi:hypothetical protein
MHSRIRTGRPIDLEPSCVLTARATYKEVHMAEPNDEFPPETDTPQAAAASRPAAKFAGSGGINAAIWKRKTDDGFEHYSVRLDRNYKTTEGNWESTPYLREGDLLRARKILDQVDDWIEQDRAKFRTSQPRDRGGRE